MIGLVEGNRSILGVPWVRVEPEPALLERLLGIGQAPIVARLLALRDVDVGGAESFLQPSAIQLPEPAGDWQGTTSVAVPRFDAAGICNAVALVTTLRLTGTPQATLHPSGRPAPAGVIQAIATIRGLLGGHPSAGSLLLRMLKLGAVAAVGGDLRNPRVRAILALGMAELDLGRQGPGLACAMNASMAFSGGLVAADVRRLARRLELGGVLSLELLQCTVPDRARELGVTLSEIRDPRPPVWERPPPARFDVELVVEPAGLTFPLQADIARLEPAGVGNVEPLVAVTGARLTRLRVIKKQHLKATLDDVDVIWRGGARHRGLFEGLLSGERPVTLLGRFGLSSWQGILRRQLRVVDAVLD
ncbi:MAG: hypothetical protein GY913_09665 [Proteobacteria bacterium]|nr:hypothetical protein [Pseudomonadota bacterium]MCP4917178.1 hypothetical protein [Pseudomonadota bacterium]